MKKILLGLSATLLAAAAAHAADVGVSIQIGQPGFYGRIDIGNAAPPPVVVAQPVWVQRRPVHVEPVYLRVPPGHQKNWAKHCAQYDACGVPVYFVREDWYHERYERPRMENEQGRDRDRGDRDNDRGDRGHGHGHGKGRDKDRD
ncbi:hypothetical protein ACG04R_05870 [Roseateles sp. BYS78W]|uniref:Uncharacterized protein n=1 Tax=Pelomonas candidula TaxID=3299025 RepID=A0ABW7H8F1_9BURK